MCHLKVSEPNFTTVEVHAVIPVVGYTHGSCSTRGRTWGSGQTCPHKPTCPGRKAPLSDRVAPRACQLDPVAA